MRKILYSTMILILSVLVLGPLTTTRVLAAPPPPPLTFNVDSTFDQPDDLTIPGTCHTAAGTCTLRAAVMQANRSSGADVNIIVPAGTYSVSILPAGLDGEENGDLNLTNPTTGGPIITIHGAGAGTTIIRENNTDRIFSIDVNCILVISGVTLLNGNGLTKGGAIYNQGLLGVNNSVISGNIAPGAGSVAGLGGGIYNSGSFYVSKSTVSGNVAFNGGGIENVKYLNISDSIISDNRASIGGGGGIDNWMNLDISTSTISGNFAEFAGGGGIFNAGSLFMGYSTLNQNNTPYSGGGVHNAATGTMNVRNSTFSGNTALDGGGIYNENGLILRNSTLSENIANNNGGGIFNQNGQANVYNTSIVFNGADQNIAGGLAGGIYNNDALAIFNLRNTLVVKNYVSNSPTYDDCHGTLTVYGNNLFWSVTGCTVNKGPGGSWDFLNDFNSVGPLQDNGGPTWTVALLPGSNAIDGGDPLGCLDSDGTTLFDIDQRNALRPVGVYCDVGAFEYFPPVVYLPLIAH